MLIAEVLDVETIDGFINDPAIFPDLGFDPNSAAVSAASFVGRPDYVFAGNAEAMMLFHREPRGWHKHNMFKASCRGRKALDAGRDLLGWFSLRHPGKSLFAETPLWNRKARWFNRQIGFHSTGFRDHPIVGQVECFERLAPCH